MDRQPSPPADILADVRDDFNHLEHAVSTGRPEIARRFVGPELYEELVGRVRDLSRRNCRRVHGAFEILTAEIDSAPAGVTATAEGVAITVHAISSLAIVDTRDHLVEGSDDLMRWTQDLTAKPNEGGRWLITSLGQLSVEGRVLGPAGPPLKTRELTEFEKRQRECEEHGRALVRVGMSLLALQY